MARAWIGIFFYKLVLDDGEINRLINLITRSHLLGLRFCVQPNEEPPKFLSDVAWAKCNNFMLASHI